MMIDAAADVVPRVQQPGHERAREGLHGSRGYLPDRAMGRAKRFEAGRDIRYVMRRWRRSSAQPRRWYSPFLVYGGGIVVVTVGLTLIGNSVLLVVVLGT